MQAEANIEEECCVCFAESPSKTPCGHPLCHTCWLCLRKPECPICRQPITFVAKRRPVNGNATTGSTSPPSAVQPAAFPPNSSLAAPPSLERAVSTVPPLPAIRAIRSDPRGNVSTGFADTPGSARSTASDSLANVVRQGLVDPRQRGNLRRSRTGLSHAQRGRPPAATLSAFFQRSRAQSSPGSQEMNASRTLSSPDRGQTRGGGSPWARGSRGSSPGSGFPRQFSASELPGNESGVSTSAGSGSGSGSGRGGKVRVGQIHTRMARMKISEAQFFARHIMWLHGEGLVEKVDWESLCRGFWRRTSEVLGSMSPNALDETTPILLALHDLATNLGGDELLRKAFENRLIYLVMQATAPGTSRAHRLTSLRKYHGVATNMVALGMVTAKVEATTMANVIRWIGLATDVDLIAGVEDICSLATSDRSVLAAVAARVRELARTGSVRTLKDVGTVITTYLDRNVTLLDEETERVLENRLRTGSDKCSLEELENSLFAAGVQFLCQHSARLRNAIELALSKRMERNVIKLCADTRRVEDIPRLRQELDEWIRVAKQGHQANMVSFTVEVRSNIIGSMSELHGRAMQSGSPLSHSVVDITSMQWKMQVCLCQICPQAS